jgi:hypothetical protein
MEPDKRDLRNTKRELKKAGNKKRRGKLKRQLRDNPADAHTNETTFGRYESKPYNGLFDNDQTRQRDSSEEED